ncbi:hypothetical protein [Burkholderia seminalis]|uniref:hypothetical protein n=1 Tax=Burkholderia seminalis TaxID=488731 RepID=UPI0031DFA82B
MDFEIPRRQPPKRSQVKRDLYRLLVARSDLGAANAACKLFLSTVSDLSDPLYQPLFTAIVVCYARPFTHNEPHGALPERWARFEEPAHQQMHNSLLKARHEVVAHSDMAVRKARIVPPGVSTGIMNGRPLISESIGTETAFYLFTIPMIQRIPRLVVSLGERIQAEIDRMIGELYDGMELPNAKFPLRIDEGL